MKIIKVGLGNTDEPALFFLRRQKFRRHLSLLCKGRLVLVARARNVGIYIVLGKAHLAPNAVGANVAATNQLVNGRAAHVQNIGHLLTRERFVLVAHSTPSFQLLILSLSL